jgi:thioredoxin reductase (NADPH)
MIIRESSVGERVKYWVRPDIENRIKEGSIRCYFNSTVTAIRAADIDISTPNGPVTIDNDWVLAMTGYQPDLAFLERAGIHLAHDTVRKPQYDEDTHETNMPGVYLAGVICGGMNTHRLFIENSREHAVKILDHIASRR